MIWYY